MLHIQPVVYGKFKTRLQICECLKKAPFQVCNSTEAFEGNVMEFQLEGRQKSPVGALSEYLEADSNFAIRTIDDFILYVKCNPSDKSFKVVNIEYFTHLNVKLDDETRQVYFIDDDEMLKFETITSNSEIDTIVENDGIGTYEFWGRTQTDDQPNYLTVDGAINIRLDLYAANFTLTEESIKKIWDYIVKCISTTRTLDKGDDGLTCDVELELKEFKVINHYTGSLLLSWEE